jgi:hypothetical protein
MTRMVRHALIAGLLILVGAVLATGELFAVDPETEAANDALAYIESLQNSDGGFPAFGTSSSAGSTLDAVFAFTAAGVDPKTVTTGGNSPADYLETQAASYSGTAGGAAKLVLGIEAMGLDPTDFGGFDAQAAMEAYYNAGTGQYGDDIFAQSFYPLAKLSGGTTPPAASVTYLEGLQLPDGGWEYCCGFGSDTNSAALALRTLVLAGVPASAPSIVDGLDYLEASQQADGGFPFVAPGDSDANSTAFVVQALIAAGENLDAGGPWDAGTGDTPIAALASFQNPLTGALVFFGEDSPFATYQGVPGLMLAAFAETPDPDSDGLDYADDNCPTVANVPQTNTDGDLSGDACDSDDDNDGCSDGAENGTNPQTGGLRDPLDIWDFMDQWLGGLRDRVVSGGDLGAVVARFGSTGSPSGDPLTPPVAQAGYHVMADRNGSYPGQAPWNLRPPDGSVSGGDIGAAVAQFGHSCSPPA